MKTFIAFFAMVLLALAVHANSYDCNAFLSQSVFASEDDTEQCKRPISGYEITDFAEAEVMIRNCEEGATVVFDVYRDNELIWKGSFKGYKLNFTVFGWGDYVIHAIAEKEGKADSPDGGVFFNIWDWDCVAAPAGINEQLNAGDGANALLAQKDLASGGKGEQCERPNSGYEVTGSNEVMVMIRNCEEGAIVVYDVYRDNELIWKGSLDGEELQFYVVGAGDYVVHAVAKKDGKLDSPDGGVFFPINNDSGISELVNGKQVAGVRYYNVAGQEMPEANGMTIVVTTYTDGTTSTAKVVK